MKTTMLIASHGDIRYGKAIPSTRLRGTQNIGAAYRVTGTDIAALDLDMNQASGFRPFGAPANGSAVLS